MYWVSKSWRVFMVVKFFFPLRLSVKLVEQMHVKFWTCMMRLWFTYQKLMMLPFVSQLTNICSLRMTVSGFPFSVLGRDAYHIFLLASCYFSNCFSLPNPFLLVFSFPISLVLIETGWKLIYDLAVVCSVAKDFGY